MFRHIGTAGGANPGYNRVTIYGARQVVTLNDTDAVERSADYMEAPIRDGVTIRQAAAPGYSLYHFCRVFSIVKGLAPGDDIRNRRLAAARSLLLDGYKVIDLALDFDFETAGGFSKAFRKEFGYSPTAYAARMSGWHPLKRSYESCYENHTGISGGRIQHRDRHRQRVFEGHRGLLGNV